MITQTGQVRWSGALAALALTACGGGGTAPAATPTPTVTPQPIPGGLLFASSTAVYYLQLLDKSGSLSGSLTYYIYAPSTSHHVDTGSYNVTGITQGDTVQLQVNGTTSTGTYRNGALDLGIPQSDGSIQPDTFTSADTSQYNAALGPVQELVAQWTTDYWGRYAICTLAVPQHDVRVFVKGSGASGLCANARAAGYLDVSTLPSSDNVICVEGESGADLAVADDGSTGLAHEICPEIANGTFGTIRAPS